MKIKLLRNTGVSGKVYLAGEVLELEETKATALIQMGKAKAVPAEVAVVQSAQKPSRKKKGKSA